MNNRRNHDIRVKCSKTEKDKVKKRAELCKMKLGVYARHILLNANIKIIVKE